MRILALSDIHGRFKDFAPEKLPPADEVDVVCIAGDVTNLGVHRPEEVAQAERWFDALLDRYKKVYYVLGNHDIGLWDGYFEAVPAHNTNELWSLEGRLVYHDSRSFTGASLSPCFDLPKLAETWVRMTAKPHVDAQYFAALPPADIVVSHCPPYGYCDKTRDGTHIGSPGLLTYIEQHKPKLVICGHVHEAHGEAMIDETRVVNVAEMGHWKVIEI